MVGLAPAPAAKASRRRGDMKQLRVIGVCALSACAISAFTAAGASATAPELGRCLKGTEHSVNNYDSSKCVKLAGEDAVSEAEQLKKGVYKWFPGVVRNKFTTKMKEATVATLETVGGTKITCKEETSTGEFINTKEAGRMVVKFNKCQTSELPCNSAGAAAEEILTSSLGGTIGFETINAVASKDTLADELHSEAGNVAEFTCAGLPVVVKGSILHKITANSMKLTATEKFTASKGEQKPDHFAGGTTDEHTLESNTNGGPFEEAGQTITGILTAEEKVEANSVL
jgi:hypothetical protein